MVASGRISPPSWLDETSGWDVILARLDARDCPDPPAWTGPKTANQEMKPTVIILALLSLFLGAILVIRQNVSRKLAEENHTLEARILLLSNQVEEVRAQLGEQEKMAAYLETNLTVRAAELAAATNLVQTTANALAVAERQNKAFEAEHQKLTNRLSQVEVERDGLQNRLNQLAQEINGLNDKIADTQRKLASAEGDRDFLTKELARLQSDKAELVRQFNDVAAVRAQLALLKEEITINQRLAWMTQGVYQRAGLKGAQALMARPQPFTSGNRPFLDVELHQNPTNTVVQP
jgi:septal ring factor EnvC (AmiA/AmiB activator)